MHISDIDGKVDIILLNTDEIKTIKVLWINKSKTTSKRIADLKVDIPLGAKEKIAFNDILPKNFPEIKKKPPLYVKKHTLIQKHI